MSIYIYKKKKPDQLGIDKNKQHLRLILTFIPYAFVVLGSILLWIVAFPFISYKILVFSKDQKKVISPVSKDYLRQKEANNNLLNPTVLSYSDDNSQPEILDEVDYNLINNWFPTAPLPRAKPSKITHYTLSIPELKIEEAVVTIGGNEVKKTLVHYPGTALPGEFGNSVIFGHSVLPIFYNPKNYESIFSTIPTLQEGDEIEIYFDGVQYTYVVEDYFEVGPNDIRVLEQRFNEQVLSLVTCVPPGTYIRRGVVKARLRGI